MFLPDVRVDRRSLLATKPAVRTLKSWLVPALVIDMPVFVPLQRESTAALLTLKRLLLLGVDHTRAYFRALPRVRHAFPRCAGPILADQIRPEGRRKDVVSWNTIAADLPDEKVEFTVDRSPF